MYKVKLSWTEAFLIRELHVDPSSSVLSPKSS